jgi:Zn-dependent protease
MTQRNALCSPKILRALRSEIEGRLKFPSRAAILNYVISMDSPQQQPVFTVEPPGAPPPRTRQPATGFGGWIAALVVLLGKYKTVLSMFLMIWVYSQFFGWPFAVGVVLLIFVHEMGHVFAAMALGIPVSAPIFIPFIGASIIMKQNPRDAWCEALMAYAGPLAGGAGGWICFVAGMELRMPMLTAIAAFTFVINLFNLIPLPPLDGGRICAAVSRWFWVLGLVLLGGAILYFRAWSMLVIAVLVLFMAFQRIHGDLSRRNSPQMQKYYQLTIGTRAFVAAFYLGLIGALLIGYSQASEQLAGLTNNGLLPTSDGN